MFGRPGICVRPIEDRTMSNGDIAPRIGFDLWVDRNLSKAALVQYLIKVLDHTVFWLTSIYVHPFVNILSVK